MENFQFGADSKGPSTGSGQAASHASEQPAQSEGEAIKYPDEEINPEDIPF